jgi:hypothetical protein
MITRVSGIVLIATVLAGVSVGIVLALRHGGAQLKGRTRLHRRLSWFALLLLVVHISAALLDRRHVPPYALVAPFVSPTRRIAGGTGSVAAWGVVVVTLTAAGRRWLRPSWRKIHYVAYPACAFAVCHSLLGSDTRLIAFWLGLWSGALLLSVVPKVRGALTSRRKPVSSLVLSDVHAGRTPGRPDQSQGAVPSVSGDPIGPPVPCLPLATDLRHRSRHPQVPSPSWDGPDVGPRRATPPLDNGRGAAASSANQSLDDALARVRAYQDRFEGVGSSPPVAAPFLASTLASEIVRQLLLDRGLTVPPDVARRTADHLMTPSRWGDERSAEFRFRQSAGEEVSVVITATDLRTAIEAAQSCRPQTPALAVVSTG